MNNITVLLYKHKDTLLLNLVAMVVRIKYKISLLRYISTKADKKANKQGTSFLTNKVSTNPIIRKNFNIFYKKDVLYEFIW